MMAALEFLIVSLAAWRMAYMFVQEDGPLGVFDRLRTRLGGALHCVYCCSVWTAALCIGLWLTPLQPIVWLFSVSGAALMLQAYTGVGVG